MLCLAWVGCQPDSQVTAVIKAHPSSAQLISAFLTHSNQFNQIRQMLVEDSGLKRVAPDFTIPSDTPGIGVSSGRLSEYRQLFSECGVQEGVLTVNPEERVEFIVSTRGLSVRGSTKGIVFDTAPQGVTIVQDLDLVAKPGTEDFVAYQKIIDNWWVYYEFER